MCLLGDFLLAIVRLIPYGDRAENAQQETHTMNRDELTLAFSSAYGRMCVLVVTALDAGYDQDQVRGAARGGGFDKDPMLDRLRTQRRKINNTLAGCKVGAVPEKELIEIAQRARKAIQQEFDCRIPVM